MSLEIKSLSRYDVRDPSDPLLNMSYKIDSYIESEKEVLTLSGAGLTSVDLPTILNPTTIYIAECDGEISNEYSSGENITKDEHVLLGVTILAYEDMKPEDGPPYKVVIMVRQPIKLNKGDVIL